MRKPAARRASKAHHGASNSLQGTVHVLLHNESTGEWKFKECLYTSTERDDVVEHRKNAHLKPLSELVGGEDDDLYRCLPCQMTFATKAELLRHVDKHLPLWSKLNKSVLRQNFMEEATDVKCDVTLTEQKAYLEGIKLHRSYDSEESNKLFFVR